MSLLHDRYEKGLEYDIVNIEDNENYILSTSLQQILENVVKHNIIEIENPIKIFISKENDYLVVKNNCNLKSKAKKTSGKGLKNIQELYAFFSDKKLIVEENKNVFIVKLPLLKLTI